jgi:hydroxymethylbilane synthase
LPLKQQIIIGTRSSRLALWQAEFVMYKIKSAFPELHVELKQIKTKGDEIPDVSLDKINDKGLFTKEIENELLAGTIDLAVHSLKDLPTDLRPGLRLAAVTERHRVEDVLIAREKGTGIDDLRDNAVVATGSVRRKAQLLYHRLDLKIEDLRGNVNTRIDKFLKSDWDGIVLAAAGVERLGLEKHISSYLPTDLILPAVGQGALGIETSTENGGIEEILIQLNHSQTFIETSAERAFLKALGGGCKTPIAALARLSGGRLSLEGAVCSPDGTSLVRSKAFGPPEKPKELGEKLASELIMHGAGKLLQ